MKRLSSASWFQSVDLIKTRSFRFAFYFIIVVIIVINTTNIIILLLLLLFD